MVSKFNKVFDLFLDTSILSLRKYENNGINVYEFDLNDLDHVLDKEVIDSIPSIYILENSIKNQYYIGETENFTSRIKDHQKSREFNKIYVINSELLNKNISLELEAKTIEKFKNSISGYEVLNKNEINNSFLSNRDSLKFKEFWKNFDEIYFLLKFNLNPKNNDANDNNVDDDVTFYCRDAKMKKVKGGYLLLKGSKIYTGEWSKTDIKYLGNVLKIRDELIKNNKIDEKNELKENLFSTYPSILATLIVGRSSSYDAWKTKEKITLNKFLGRK